MDWRLAMARLQLQLEGLSQAGWRPPTAAAAAASLVRSAVRTLLVSVVTVDLYLLNSRCYHERLISKTHRHGTVLICMPPTCLSTSEIGHACLYFPAAELRRLCLVLFFHPGR